MLYLAEAGPTGKDATTKAAAMETPATRIASLRHFIPSGKPKSFREIRFSSSIDDGALARTWSK